MKEIIKCPKCGKVLKSDEIDSISVYHNTLDYKCKLCGHQDHWMSFIEDENCIE